MGTDKCIQILLSTYNGEKYLKQQLDSFVSQDRFSDIKVLIRDDGSTDGTLDILREYSDKYGFEVIEGHNVGVNESMCRLFSVCDMTCQYFALSDQDDVWLPNKISEAVKALSDDKENCALFASVSRITDSELKPFGLSTAAKRGVSFYNAVIENVCPGHTQVFNRALMSELRSVSAEDVSVIDHWIYLLAGAIGKVYFSGSPTVLHRQHGKNAVGYQTNPIKKFFTRIRRLDFKKPDRVTLQLNYFLKRYENRILKEYSDEAKRFINSTRFFSRLKYSFTTKLYRQSFMDNIFFRMMFCLGKYHL